MPSSRPTNGELAVMITGLQTEVREGFKHGAEKLVSIETKQDHTNGRVRKLEAWKYMMMGALIIMNLVAVPIIVNWIQHLILRE
jgi:hypothetical protein